MQTTRSRYALWAVFAATAAVRIGFGGIAPVLPLYAQAHGLSTLMIAFMTNAYMLSATFFQGYAGHLGDRLGRRPVMIAGTWLYTVAAALFLFNGGPWFYVVLRAIEGLGACAFGPTVRAFIADITPRSKRGQVFGQLATFDMVGILIGPMIGGLAQQVGGPKAPFAMCALLGLISAIPLWLFTQPGRVGTAAEDMEEAEPGTAVTVSTWRIMRAPAFWAVALPGIGFAYLNGLYSVIWSLFMTRIGSSSLQITLSFTLFALPMVIFLVPFGRLGDKIGRHVMVGVGGALGSLITLSYGIFPYPWALVGLSGMDGIASSLITPANQAFMADVAPQNIRGKFMGLVGATSTGATMVAATIIGYVYETANPLWLFVIGAISVAFACGSAYLIMSRVPVGRLRSALERLG